MSTDKNQTLQGRLYGATNNHQAYAIFYSTSDILAEIGKILVSEFGCTEPDPPIIGWNNNVNTRCRRKNIELVLGWDHLTGFYIVSNSFEGDKLVKEVGIYLNRIISGKDFKKYIRDS